MSTGSRALKHRTTQEGDTRATSVGFKDLFSSNIVWPVTGSSGCAAVKLINELVVSP